VKYVSDEVRENGHTGKEGYFVLTKRVTGKYEIKTKK